MFAQIFEEEWRQGSEIFVVKVYSQTEEPQPGNWERCHLGIQRAKDPWKSWNRISRDQILGKKEDPGKISPQKPPKELGSICLKLELLWSFVQSQGKL